MVVYVIGVCLKWRELRFLLSPFNKPGFLNCFCFDYFRLEFHKTCLVDSRSLLFWNGYFFTFVRKCENDI